MLNQQNRSNQNWVDDLTNANGKDASEAAFADLFNILRKGLYNYWIQRANQPFFREKSAYDIDEFAQDVTIEGILRIQEKLDDFDVNYPGKFTGWAFVVALNIGRQHIRKQKHEISIEANEESGDDERRQSAEIIRGLKTQHDFEGDLDRSRFAEDVADCSTKLTELQRTCFSISQYPHKFHGKTRAQWATERLDISSSAYSYHVHAAKKKLRKLLAEKGYEEEGNLRLY